MISAKKTDEIDRETALGLLNYAASYLKAAEYLYEQVASRELRLAFDAPNQLLLGHSIEITLKSFLRFKGYNNRQLQELGHNLEHILLETEKLGLRVQTSAEQLLNLQILNNQFGKPEYEVRYLKTGTRMALDPTAIIIWIRSVETLVRPDIQASYFAADGS